jgi:multisubunit Na+/H+ antiporter MnhE subunit
MTRHTALGAAAELLAWWAVLALLWLVFISSVDTLERIVGASVAAIGALVARAGRRAVNWR